MNKRIGRSSAARKAAEWLATLTPEERASLPPEQLPPAEAPERRARRKQVDDREREKFRPRQRAPRGFRFGEDGDLEKPGEPTVQLAIEAPGGVLVSAEVQAPPIQDVSEMDRWMASRLVALARDVTTAFEILPDNRTLDRPRKRAETAKLDAMRKAYEAAFEAPEMEWRNRLLFALEGLARSLQGKRGKKGARPAMNGTEIARALRIACPPGTVPQWLTGEVIERLAREATLARGGGKKGKRSIPSALDALIAKHS